MSGKQIAQHVYHHISALETLPPSFLTALRKAAALANARPGEDFNVVKFGDDGVRLTLLDYPQFFTEAFPLLRRFWTVDLVQESVRLRSYAESLNPPILHRKELLLAANHPHRPAFAQLTAAAEQIGLFDQPTRIGFQQAWAALLQQRGYRVVDHALLPLGNDETAAAAAAPCVGVARHLTALSRANFSAPVQTLLRLGLLDGGKTLFDYGCGRGDDLRSLREQGIAAHGWDPHYAADQPLRRADIVNLGFVINVIEDRHERLLALRNAYALAEELLVVAAMLASADSGRGQPFADGVLTSRNTFQKYFSQDELHAYLAEALGVAPLPVAPGIFYLFKSQAAEQRFLAGRQENRRTVQRLRAVSAKPAANSPPASRPDQYAAHRPLLERLWQQCLQLGRLPERAEIAETDAVIAAFGSIGAALRAVKASRPDAETLLAQARQSRIDDVRVYFAQLQFVQRPAYHQLESRLQADVKAFFGDFARAQHSGRELLFAAGRPDSIAAACQDAAERGIGWLEAGESLQLPTAYIVQLPPVLRTYIACGLRLYGDAGVADLLKIHIRSGKLSLMRFDDFLGTPLPKLMQRVKISLRNQAFQIFDYGAEHEPTYLYRKARFINEEFPHYAEQLAFDETMEAIGLYQFTGYGPSAKLFDARLEQARYCIDGFQLTRSQRIPKLDARCGQYFTYRQLIECGETQAATGLANVPQQPDSYTALHDLAVHILDPVLDYFGMIELTYGFCSAELAKHIPGRIAPKLDQHAACELNSKNLPICPRLGAAVDFIIPDENMYAVAEWVARNTPFDRLYYYGPAKPIHVSYHPKPTGEFVEMRETASGRRVPRVVKALCRSAYAHLNVGDT